MPHDEKCPYDDCGKPVKDWFIEWYPKSRQYEIGAKRLAMDCPWCRRPVEIQGLRVALPTKKAPAEVRDYDVATKYAADQPEGYASLEAFLSDPLQAEKAAPYKQDYWKSVNIP